MLVEKLTWPVGLVTICEPTGHDIDIDRGSNSLYLYVVMTGKGQKLQSTKPLPAHA